MVEQQIKAQEENLLHEIDNNKEAYL